MSIIPMAVASDGYLTGYGIYPVGIAASGYILPVIIPVTPPTPETQTRRRGGKAVVGAKQDPFVQKRHEDDLVMLVVMAFTTLQSRRVL